MYIQRRHWLDYDPVALAVLVIASKSMPPSSGSRAMSPKKAQDYVYSTYIP
jgi:hypothetical protein